MAKGPAVLFYTADFLVGTKLMNYEQKGKYIELLCLQHQQGHLSEEDMLLICGTYDKKIFDKFQLDNEGFYFNSRMDEEIDKRENFVNVRRENGAKGGRPKKPKENLLENNNENINIVISYMNNKLGTKYKHTSEYIRKYIKARLGEGFTPEDFYTVIDKKIHEWRGTKLEKFLRPETLFGTKFQEYLNQIGGRDEDYEKSNAPPPTPTKIRHGDFDPNKALERALERSL